MVCFLQRYVIGITKKSNLMKGQGLLSFLSGAAIGIAVALLFAPDSGVNTRQRITEKLRQNGQKMKEAIDESLHCCEDQ